MLTNEDYLNIFHEIKNSITLIGSSLQLVEKKHPEVTDFTYWAETMTEISSLRNMVTELSSVRLCNHLNLRPINLHIFMDELHDSVMALSMYNFNCTISVENDVPQIEFDPQLIKQALINLIKNAYEAMDKTGTVAIAVSRCDSFVKITVTDKGGGLDPAFADSIFEPFITSKNGGSGLGLSITKQIAESHHGSICCDSRPGDGCTFTLTLPINQN